MKTRFFLLAGALTALALSASKPAFAIPIDQMVHIGNPATENVRVVCDRWGRCWRTGPRRVYRYYDGPAYGYYGYGGPYYYGPGYYRRPGFGFSFGF